MPTFLQARRLLRTYTADAGSAPTRITANPGGGRPTTPRNSTRLARSSSRASAMRLPSRICAVIGFLGCGGNLADATLVRDAVARHPGLREGVRPIIPDELPAPPYETIDRTRSRSVPAPARTSRRPQGRTEHRPDDCRWLLPQLPVRLVPGCLRSGRHSTGQGA